MLPNCLKDEMIVDATRVSLIEEHKDRLEENFQVKIGYGLKAMDGARSQQWLTLKGHQDDRLLAKVKVQ